MYTHDKIVVFLCYSYSVTIAPAVIDIFHPFIVIMILWQPQG